MVTKGRPLFESNADREARLKREREEWHEAQRAEERAAERLRRQEEPTELEQLQDRVEKLEAVLAAIASDPWGSPGLRETIRRVMRDD